MIFHRRDGLLVLVHFQPFTVQIQCSGFQFLGRLLDNSMAFFQAVMPKP